MGECGAAGGGYSGIFIILAPYSRDRVIVSKRSLRDDPSVFAVASPRLWVNKKVVWRNARHIDIPGCSRCSQHDTALWAVPPSPCGSPPPKGRIGSATRAKILPLGGVRRSREGGHKKTVPTIRDGFLSWGIQVDFTSETQWKRYGIRAVSAQPTERIRE